MNLIAYFFPKLQTAKDVVRQISKKSRFRTPFDNQHAKETQILLEYSRQHFYQNFPSLCWKLSFKVSLLVICDSLGVFVKTLAVDDKYFLCNSYNLLQPI